MSEEKSESGSPIYRHEAREQEWVPPESSAVHLEAIESHLEDHIGEIETVYHELVSDLVHLDVYPSLNKYQFSCDYITFNLTLLRQMLQQDTLVLEELQLQIKNQLYLPLKTLTVLSRKFQGKEQILVRFSQD